MAILENLGSFALPLVMALLAFIFIFSKKTDVSVFLAGGAEGIRSAFSLMPSLVLIIIGVKMLSASGALDFLARILAAPAAAVGVPSELLPLLITRPFSGSGSIASYSELMREYGADSFVSFAAAVIMGSSDTIVYIIGVYFSSVGVKKTRYAFPAAFTVMFFCIFFACFLSRLFFACE